MRQQLGRSLHEAVIVQATRAQRSRRRKQKSRFKLPKPKKQQ